MLKQLTAAAKITLTQCENHVYFWIKNEVLYETYNTIRGRRYRVIMPVPGLPDVSTVTEDQLNYMCSTHLVCCDNCEVYYLPACQNDEVGKQFRFEPQLCFDCAKKNHV